MKATLLRSVAASALLTGASIAIPVTGYVGAAVAQTKTTTPDSATPKPADNGAAGGAMKSDSGDSSGAAKSGADSSTGAAASGSDSSTGAAATDTDKSSGAMKSGSDKSGTAASGSDTDTTKSSDAAKPSDSSASSGETVVKEQKDSEVLASTYIGQSVYNSNNKSIGDISDLVFNKTGGIQAAVIGVGGFLGIGQKDVAVKFDRIKIERKADSADVKLVTDMTSDQLKKAPAFKNLQSKMDEQNAAKQPAGGAGAMGGAGGAGAMGGAGGAATGGATGTTGAQ